LPTDAPTGASTAADAQRASKNWLWPVLFIAAVALAMLISGLHEERGPNGLHVIRDEAESLDVMRQAARISSDAMSRYEKGQELSAQDIEQLKKAATLYDEVEVFKPREMGVFVLGGRVHMVLGDLETAKLNFKQALDDAPPERNSPAADVVRLLSADAHDYLAKCYEATNEWRDAYMEVNQAIEMKPANTDYYYDRARAEIQLVSLDAAEADLKHVLAAEPDNTHAAMLLKLVKHR
jgi:tetratricopeptide (TPR) repeat protein